MNKKLSHPEAHVSIESAPKGKNIIRVDLFDKKSVMPFGFWETSYPVDLIEKMLWLKGPAYLCDEIMREESPQYVESSLRHDILSYLDESEFSSKRILDFACGSGASTCVLARMFPQSTIVGIELQSSLLEVAKLRQQHYGLTNIMYIQSPDPYSLPNDLGGFDFVVLSAVFEHLLPKERTKLMPKIWQLLEPAGVMFLDQTPYRYFPIEVHTTHLPLVNYFPDQLACWYANKFSKGHVKHDWETWLRRGIRGTTVKEVMTLLTKNCQPTLLVPERQGVNSRVDLWSKAALDRHPKRLKRYGVNLVRMVNSIPGIVFLPELSLAIQKPPH